jgi:hypothetical protein
MPHQQNAFGILGQTKSDDKSVETVTTQVAALTFKSQITASTAANVSQHTDVVGCLYSIQYKSIFGASYKVRRDTCDKARLLSQA